MCICITESLCCCSVAQSCRTLCNPMDGSTPGFPVFHHLPELAQTHVHWVGDAIQCLLLPLLLLPSIFPSISVFSNESALCIRWPKYWSFSFSISPSNKYSALISFRIDLFDLLAVQGTLKSLLQHHSSKALILCCSALKNFENYLASMWDECNCTVVWAFFHIAFLWNWNENWPFPVLWPLLFSKFSGIVSEAL